MLRSLVGSEMCIRDRSKHFSRCSRKCNKGALKRMSLGSLERRPVNLPGTCRSQTARLQPVSRTARKTSQEADTAAEDCNISDNFRATPIVCYNISSTICEGPLAYKYFVAQNVRCHATLLATPWPRGLEVLISAHSIEAGSTVLIETGRAGASEVQLKDQKAVGKMIN